MWAVKASQFTPPWKAAGQRQNDGTRVPPWYGEFFAPRMPALKTAAPVAVPLSVMNTTSVLSLWPQALSRSIRRPKFSSTFSIMP